MICPKCNSSFLFINKTNGEKLICKKCKFSQKYKDPDYDNYHNERYNYNFIRNEKNDPLIKKIVKSMNFKKNDIVLDYGCGAGDFSNTISFYTNNVVGLDIKIKNAAIKFPLIKFLEQKSNKIDFPDNYFDKIVAVNVIEHVHDYMHLLNEFKRVLKKGGKLFISSYDSNFILHSILNDPTHVIEWNQRQFEELIGKQFLIVKSFKYGSFFNYKPINKIIVKILQPEICIVAILKKN